jgi:hypothetical protein
VFVAVDPLDMRGSFDALAGAVRRLGLDPVDGHLYLFFNKRREGVLAAVSKWRARVVPPSKPPTESDDTKHDCSTCTAKDKRPTHRSGYRPWRELLMRSFKIDVEHCQSCGARMKLRALVMTTSGIERYLRWLGEPVDPPTLARARVTRQSRSQPTSCWGSHLASPGV